MSCMSLHGVKLLQQNVLQKYYTTKSCDYFPLSTFVTAVTLFLCLPQTWKKALNKTSHKVDNGR